MPVYKFGLIYAIISINILNNYASLTTQNINQSGRIVGGDTADIRDFPYLMQLHTNGQFMCGATLIDKRHVLTAAHCVQGAKESTLLVVGGTSYSSGINMDQPGVRRRVDKILLPKAYNIANMHMDVAVLKLTEDMSGRHIDSLPLCNMTLKANEAVTIAGWGRVRENSKEAAVRLRTTQVLLMPRATCKQKYRGFATISRSMFCASRPGVADACAGDSGGPAVYKKQLCGIVSWGIGCARARYPGVYTNVKVAQAFIKEALKR